MLPSTGYFKAINCPFYENGYCERPYCHFRHSRRDGPSTSTMVTAETSQTIQKAQSASTAAAVSTANPAMIQHLVSEAVKKVLEDQNLVVAENIVSKVVEGLKPNLPNVLSATSTVKPDNKTQDPVISSSKSSKCVYNPTPITELKKRHIPITAYEPARESKAIKRKSPDSEKPWMDVIRNIPMKEPKCHRVRYKPTAISQINTEVNSVHSYSSSLKSDSSLDLYNSNNDLYVFDKKKKKEYYHPKPKKRREEYVPRKPKIPLKLEQSLEDDSYDVDVDDLICVSDSNPSIAVDEESVDLEVVEHNFQNIKNVATSSTTKEKDKIVVVDTNMSIDEKEMEDTRSQDEDTNDENDEQEEQSRAEESSKFEENESKHKSKFSEKLDSEESKHSKNDSKTSTKHKDKNEDVKYNKNNENDLKHGKNREDTKYNKKEEDSKHSKSRDKDRGDEKRDKDKDRAKSKEKDRHKHSSKSNEKERSSSSSKEKSREKDKDKTKDSRESKENKHNSHRSKKDSKSVKERSSSSRDSKRDSKDRDSKDRESKEKERSKHKSDDKSQHKSKTSSDSKSKSSKHSSKSKSSDSRSSHSSHKSDKSKSVIEKELYDKEDNNDKIEEKSDQEGKCDSPEYEEFSPMYDEHLLEDSESDHDVEEECRKIFQEYEVSDHPKDITSKAPPKPEVEETEEESSKKRIAHAAAATSLTKPVGPSQPVKRLPNPQQKMYERWRMMREIAAEKAAEKAAACKAAEVAFQKKIENNDHQVNGNGRLRIAQVPYAMSLALEKKKVMELAAKVEPKTVAQTKKGGARVAHIPLVVPQLIRPEPLHTSGTQKFPLNVRQFYVNAMQDICTQIYTNADDAAQRAVKEEFSCYERCKALNVYKNSCMLTVHRLRKEVDQKSDDVAASYSGLISHEAVLAGKVKGTYSVIKSKKAATDFRGVTLYNMLTKWIMSEQDLRDNGYPRPHPDGSKGRAKLYTSNKRGQSNPSKVPNERFCCRCNKPFTVDKHGFPLRKENCFYHYARKFTYRGESKYICCKQDGTSDGCCDAPTHVWDFVDVENLRGYVSTLANDNVPAERQGIFSLDCEMCYTTQGLELTRVTVINDKLEVVYETLVKPTHPIIDFNTRFSGISESDMKNVTTTLLDVQATLLTMFSSKTILIGHSLESDFKALRLLHETVIDTSVMFPHKNGPPFKRALKNLCSEYLRKIIQNDLGGHDSKEDAMACMELILWKVKEEAKLQ